MGVIKRGILGGFSGSVAGVVGSSWKGIAVIKAKPLSVANPKTSKQVAQRGKFKACQQAASEMLTAIVKPLWDRGAQLMSGYNDFIRRNIDAYTTAGMTTVANFLVTPGKLPETAIASIVITDASKNCVVNWVDDSGSDEKVITDYAYVVAYNANNDEYAYKGAEVERGDEQETVIFETALATGDVISVWLTFRSTDALIRFRAGSDLSNSVQ